MTLRARPLPRDPSEYTAAEGQAVERAYTNRRIAVTAHAKSLVLDPKEVEQLIDSHIADMISRLMYAHARDGTEAVLKQANNLCWEVFARAVLEADARVPEVDDEQISQQMQGDTDDGCMPIV